jgi:hypothetical protein
LARASSLDPQLFLFSVMAPTDQSSSSAVVGGVQTFAPPDMAICM